MFDLEDIEVIQMKGFKKNGIIIPRRYTGEELN
jgi:hypothetical protein